MSAGMMMIAVVSDEAIAQMLADNEGVAAEREHYRHLYLRTLEQCRKLKLGLLGPKSDGSAPTTLS
jgi:hypothetical protein